MGRYKPLQQWASTQLEAAIKVSWRRRGELVWVILPSFCNIIEYGTQRLTPTKQCIHCLCNGADILHDLDLHRPVPTKYGFLSPIQLQSVYPWVQKIMCQASIAIQSRCNPARRSAPVRRTCANQAVSFNTDATRCWPPNCWRSCANQSVPFNPDATG